jgi:hypothetical protein
MKLEILNEIRYRVKVMHQNQLTLPRGDFYNEYYILASTSKINSTKNKSSQH